MITADKFSCEVPSTGQEILECTLPNAGLLEWLTAIGTVLSAVVAVAVAFYSVHLQKRSEVKALKAESELAFNKAATRVAEAFDEVVQNGQNVTRQTMYRVSNAIQALGLVDYSKEYSGDKLIFVLDQINQDFVHCLYGWSTLRQMEQNSADDWASQKETRERYLNEMILEVRHVLDNIQISKAEEIRASLVSDLYVFAEAKARSLALTEPRKRQ